ncbi:unnamed protein product [Phytomonas sp. Hart1]|nr:unnamed protein product [Phytomonas sp. Hart1]|eukprot:CCW69241.1 unnamed protein product [Phytomonas sp. isolate Hart1]
MAPRVSGHPQDPCGGSFPLLYGWIERMGGEARVDLLQPALPAWESPGLPWEGVSPKARMEGVESAGRVVGALSFVLHVVSRPLPGLAAFDPTALEDDARRGGLPPSGNPAGSADARGFSAPSSSFSPSSGRAEGGASADCFGEAERLALERRDDREMVRNAVETVLRYAQLWTEHPGSTGSVYRDHSTGCEYIKLEPNGK